MVRPKAVFRLGPALLFALLLWLCIFASVRAFAVPYTPPAGSTTEPVLEGSGSCPPGPAEPYEGEDDAAGEGRLQRAELVEVCEALSTRTDEVAHRLWWLVAEALEAKDQRVLTNTLLSEVRDRLDPPVDTRVVSVAGGALPVEDSSGEQYTDDLVSAVDASGGATKEALWFLAGLLAMLAGSVLYGHVKP